MDAQKDKLRKYAEFQDMEIVGEYSDEGHSGKNIKGRQEFMRMLNDIEDSKDGVDFGRLWDLYINIDTNNGFQFDREVVIPDSNLFAPALHQRFEEYNKVQKYKNIC